jgi:hypothetical protein
LPDATTAGRQAPPLKAWKFFPHVAVLDEHDLPAAGDQPAVSVHKPQLERIAKNGNDRIDRTNDWTPLAIGHTKDGGPEKPVEGYAGNFTVEPFTNAEGERVWALYCDQYLDDEDGRADERARKFPRRSVELWTGRWQVDPICMLGATSPERDLGLLVRYARDAGGRVVDRIVSLPAPRAYAKGEGAVADEKDRKDEKPAKEAKGERAETLPEEPEENPEGQTPDADKKLGDMSFGDFMAMFSQTPQMQFLNDLMQHADALGGEPGGMGAGDHPDPEGRLFHEPTPVRFDAAVGGAGSPGVDNTYVPYQRGGYYDEDFFDYPPAPPAPRPTAKPPEAKPVETPRPTARTADNDAVVKLERKLAALESDQSAAKKELATLRAENDELRRYNRQVTRQAAMTRFLDDEQLDYSPEAASEDFERFKVADMTDDQFEDHKGWLKKRYSRGGRLPANGQRVDYARTPPKPDAGPAPDGKLTGAEYDRVMQVQAARGCSFDEAKAIARNGKA